jgi:hypothetical protein
MKKIVVLVVCLLAINSSFVMGMGRGPQENRALQRKTAAASSRPFGLSQKELQRQRDIEVETAVLAVGKAVACTFSMLPLTLLQSSDLRHSKESVCFDSTLITALWAVHILTIAGSVYEIHTQKPFLGSRSKNMILSAGEFVASATPMICSAMVNDCPNVDPDACIAFKDVHSVVSFLAAAYCLYQASLNK